jgi:hypothetical protein
MSSFKFSFKFGLFLTIVLFLIVGIIIQPVFAPLDGIQFLAALFLTPMERGISTGLLEMGFVLGIGFIIGEIVYFVKSRF